MARVTRMAAFRRNRLLALARAGKALPWGRSDAALAKMRLARRYSEPFGGDYADLTGEGLAAAQRIAKGAGRP